MFNERDVTSYSQKCKNRIPSIIEFKGEKTGVSYRVHRHIDYPETWLISSNGIFDKVSLSTDDLAKAKLKAKNKMQLACKNSMERYAAALKELCEED